MRTVDLRAFLEHIKTDEQTKLVKMKCYQY